MILITLLAFFESFLFPWAPALFIYTLLAFYVGLKYVKWEFKFKKEFILLFLITIVILSIPSFFGNYILISLKTLMHIAFTKFNLPFFAEKFILIIILLIWAPITEEMLYRAWFYEIHKKHGSITLAFASSFFFALKHAFHFLLITPYPTLSGLMYFLSTFFFGLILAYVYEKGGFLSSYLFHFSVNLVICIFYYFLT